MEPIKHECGVVQVRLLKPLDYYKEKYGTYQYGLNLLYLLMEKQHNRGQEGAGIVCVKQKVFPGNEYMFRERAVGANSISEIFGRIGQQHHDLLSSITKNDISLASQLPYVGEIYMGHLRYSTTKKSGLSYVHPFLRRNNWRVKNLALCGNFNLTNVDEVFENITASGQHPRLYADTYIMLEQMGHRLDREVERVYNECVNAGLSGIGLTEAIEDRIEITNVLESSSSMWDGGYVICGVTGSGETFALRDPWGIRPAFWYGDNEIVVLASERPVIQTALHIPTSAVRELAPGEALLTSKGGMVRLKQIIRPREKRACSFERIYFSRGSDADIYKERKELGKNIVPAILKTINYDVKNAVFSYIPNTAEVAFYGMLEGLDTYLNNLKAKEIEQLGTQISASRVEEILKMRIRSEKVAIKDIKLRTFIAEGNCRNDLASHVYDITYGSIVPERDSLVIIDDSIVRGTTLKQSIIGILSRLRPKKLVIVSSAPQVRYPDYYGIDMANVNEFIAFKAAIKLLQENGLAYVIDKAYRLSKSQAMFPKEKMKNYVTLIYEPFTDMEISKKIAELLTPKDIGVDVEIVFQSLDKLHEACSEHTGDWYFSGNYPTAGGVKLLNQDFIDYIENVYLKEYEESSIDS